MKEKLQRGCYLQYGGVPGRRKNGRIVKRNPLLRADDKVRDGRAKTGLNGLDSLGLAQLERTVKPSYHKAKPSDNVTGKPNYIYFVAKLLCNSNRRRAKPR